MPGARLSGFVLRGPALRWRIIIVLLVAAFLPLAIAAFGAWIVFGNLLEQKALEQMRTEVQSHARAIEANLAERVHLLQILVVSRTKKDISDPVRLRLYLEELNHSSGESFVDLGVIDEKGRHLAYVGPYDLQDRNYLETDWFKEVMSRGVYISDVFLGFRRVPHCIIAVKAEDSGRPWILRATINSDQFDALVTSGDLGDNSDAYLVNRQGLYQTRPRVGALLEKAPIDSLTFHRGVRDSRVMVADSVKIRVTTWINDDRWMLVVERGLAAVQAPVNEAIAKGALVVAMAVGLLVVTTFLATWHLIGQIDRANAQREKMTQAFMRSAKLASIGELATGLAHEINNPLAIINAEQTNISDLVAELNENPAPGEQILQSVERAKKQIQRCANITRKMLQFGRQRETSLEPTDIVPRLEEIVNLLRRQAAIRNVEIKIEIDNDLPPALADPVEFEQVIVNLINNALDAMHDGGEITIRAFSGDNQIHLEIKDTGSGIAPENLERIFEPFFTTKPVGKGTGLGLSVCYGIVHSWGGRIRAESALNTGTTMHIALPPVTDKRKFKDR
nr:hypothetical protein [candidate division Zixibacteria bacterium]